MIEEPEPPVCIHVLDEKEVPEFYETIAPQFQKNGGRLRNREIEEIYQTIQEYFTVKINGIIGGCLQLRESEDEERYLELGAFLVCAENSADRRAIRNSIIEYACEEAKQRVLTLISLTIHPSLTHLYEKKGAVQEKWVFPRREALSPWVPLYIFDEERK